MKAKIILVLSLSITTLTHAQVNTSKDQKAAKSNIYLTVGNLRSAEFNNTLILDEPGIEIPYRLYYPQQTEIVQLGMSGPFTKSGWLHGFFNIGIPFRDIRADVNVESQTITEGLHVATMYMDFGLSIYPLEFTNKNSRFQPFLQGGLGFNLIADNWWVILLAGLTDGSTSTTTSDTRTIIYDSIEMDWLFSLGGGIDYFFTDNTGLRLSVRNLKLHLPGEDWSFSPFEINLGIVGKF